MGLECISIYQYGISWVAWVAENVITYLLSMIQVSWYISFIFWMSSVSVQNKLLVFAEDYRIDWSEYGNSNTKNEFNSPNSSWNDNDSSQNYRRYLCSIEQTGGNVNTTVTKEMNSVVQTSLEMIKILLKIILDNAECDKFLWISLNSFI